VSGPEQVPASTRIRTRSIRNVDTDRLRRRRDWLIANKVRIAREADGRPVLRRTAKEIVLINRELVARRAA